MVGAALHFVSMKTLSLVRKGFPKIVRFSGEVDILATVTETHIEQRVKGNLNLWERNNWQEKWAERSAEGVGDGQGLLFGVIS